MEYIVPITKRLLFKLVQQKPRKAVTPTTALPIPVRETRTLKVIGINYNRNK